MYQQITLIGNLGSDPEMRYTPGGDAVASFRMAVSKQWTKDGAKQEKTTWFRVTTWRKTAENVSTYLKKGRQVMVVGEMEEANAYTDKTGKPAATLEVTAYEVKFLGGNPKDNGSPQASAQANKATIEDSSIPF